MPRRVLSVWFAHLAAERALRRDATQDSARPFAVTGMRKSALRICSVNAAAEAQGLMPGMTLADARAICPELASTTEQPRRDARCLKALGRWCERYSPWIALDGSDGLILDITGCAHLLGGEHALLNDLTMRLAAMRLTAHAGLADTQRAAKGLARFAGPVGIAAPGRTREAVTGLPLAALGIGAGTAATLARLGLRRIGDIDGMPRSALARRFGADLVLYMDQMLGAEPDPLSPTAFEAPHAVRLSLPEPIGKTGDVIAALRRLLDRLCARLERERQGARAFRLWVRRCDGGGDAAEIGLARPSQDPERIAPLFERTVETLDAGFGFDALRLEALEVEPLKPEQGSVWNGASRHDAALGDLIARIGNRIGFDRVIRFQPAESHIPERAYTIAAAAYSEPARFPDSGAMRPIALFAPEPVQAEDAAIPPARFQWRRELFETTHAQGPERIAPEWWWDDPAWRSGPRDYWCVQTRQGARLWLYQTHGPETAGWFAQGEFA